MGSQQDMKVDGIVFPVSKSQTNNVSAFLQIDLD